MYQLMIDSITTHPDFLSRISWGEPRPGHPEGTIAKHIAEIETNISKLPIAHEAKLKLRVIALVHDLFKKDAMPYAAISDPCSHASLAAKFLSQFTNDTDLIAMVQWHDEPYAIGRKHTLSVNRFLDLESKIKDRDLFALFLICDAFTGDKTNETLYRFLELWKPTFDWRTYCELLFPNFGWENDWEETPAPVANCRELEHKVSDTSTDRGNHLVICHDCKIKWHYDSGD